MAADTFRRVDLTRLSTGRYQVTNARGGTMVLGQGDPDDPDTFTPVELLLAAIAGCSAIDVELITGKRSEPIRFEVAMSGDKVRDEDGHHMADLRMVLDAEFPDDDGGRGARDVLPRAVQQSHDRLCTVMRTVQLPSPIQVVVR